MQLISIIMLGAQCMLAILVTAKYYGFLSTNTDEYPVYLVDFIYSLIWTSLVSFPMMVFIKIYSGTTNSFLWCAVYFGMIFMWKIALIAITIDASKCVKCFGERVNPNVAGLMDIVICLVTWFSAICNLF